MINGKTGYLVDFNSQEIADKAIVLIKDQKLLDEMGKFGRKRIEEEWTWDKSVDALEKMLINLINH